MGVEGIFLTGWTGMSECSSAHGCALAAADRRDREGSDFIDVYI